MDIKFEKMLNIPCLPGGQEFSMLNSQITFLMTLAMR